MNSRASPFPHNSIEEDEPINDGKNILRTSCGIVSAQAGRLVLLFESLGLAILIWPAVWMNILLGLSWLCGIVALGIIGVVGASVLVCCFRDRFGLFVLGSSSTMALIFRLMYTLIYFNLRVDLQDEIDTYKTCIRVNPENVCSKGLRRDSYEAQEEAITACYQCFICMSFLAAVALLGVSAGGVGCMLEDNLALERGIIDAYSPGGLPRTTSQSLPRTNLPTPTEHDEHYVRHSLSVDRPVQTELPLGLPLGVPLRFRNYTSTIANNHSLDEPVSLDDFKVVGDDFMECAERGELRGSDSVVVLDEELTRVLEQKNLSSARHLHVLSKLGVKTLSDCHFSQKELIELGAIGPGALSAIEARKFVGICTDAQRERKQDISSNEKT